MVDTGDECFHRNTQKTVRVAENKAVVGLQGWEEESGKNLEEAISECRQQSEQ